MATRYETIAARVNEHYEMWGETSDFEAVISIMHILHDMPDGASAEDLREEIADFVDRAYGADGEGFFDKRDARFEKDRTASKDQKSSGGKPATPTPLVIIPAGQTSDLVPQGAIGA